MIYFILDRRSAAVKIGYTNYPVEHRVAQGQTWHAFPLEVIAVVDGTAADERGLHDRFEAQRLLGEWFSIEGDLKRFLQCEFGRSLDARPSSETTVLTAAEAALFLRLDADYPDDEARQVRALLRLSRQDGGPRPMRGVGPSHKWSLAALRRWTEDRTMAVTS